MKSLCMDVPFVALWAGGARVVRLQSPAEGVQLMGPLSDLSAEVIAWRDPHDASAR